MTYRTILLAIALLLSCTAASAVEPGPKEITLTNFDGDYVVPAGRIWRLDGLPPQKESEKGISTADIYIDGQVFVGDEKDLSLYGKFDISVNVTQRSPIWILEGARVRVGDSRARIVLKEFNY